MRNVDVKVEDEVAALILLVSLPLSFEKFVQSFVVGKDIVSLEEVRSAMHTRELRHKASNITDNKAAGLVVFGGKKNGISGNNTQFQRGPKPDDVCNYCKEEGH